MVNDIENGAVLRIAESERHFVDHPGDIEECLVCNEELDTASSDVIKLCNGHIHADCLEEYCENEGSTSDYATEFVKEHFEDFMEFVRNAG